MHLSGPAEVIAGPGSGKTFTIICRILYLIRQCQIDPDKILVITYTKAAAEEMSGRFRTAVSEISGISNPVLADHFSQVHFGTFHGICWQILHQSGGRNYSLIKETQKRELIGHLLKNAGFSGQVSYDMVSDMINEISRGKNLTDFVTDSSACMVKDPDYKVGTLAWQDYWKIKDGYERYLREQALIDFDDMITECLKLFYAQPAILNRYQMQFAYILADEFQDINLPQYRLLKLLALPQNNLFVVGDDDQAIYGFRGATPGIMKQFLTDFPQGKQLMLTENYRSGRKIVLLAKKVIGRNKNRFDKEFCPINQGGVVHLRCCESRKMEEQALLGALRTLDKESLNQSAVILRTNLEVMQYRELFRMAKLPVFGKAASDTDILRSFIMEDMVSFLSFIYLGHQRTQLVRFMNKPARFFSREALVGETVTLPQFQQYYRNNPVLQKRAEDFWGQLMLAGKLHTDLALSLFRNALGYDGYLAGKAADTRQADLWQKQADRIQQYLADYPPGSDLKRYLQNKEKSTDGAKEDLVQKDGIHLITMHGAKGLEFDRVYLPDVNEGVIPGKRCKSEEDFEEERRLLYVAITRARSELNIYYTKERGRTLSRYLDGLFTP